MTEVVIIMTALGFGFFAIGKGFMWLWKRAIKRLKHKIGEIQKVYGNGKEESKKG